MQKLFRRLLFVLVIAAMLLGQGTWALAGTTGTLTGVVTETPSGAPLANAHVTAMSASETASAVTDANGHFTFVSLTPDTYTVSAVKAGYDATSQAGVNVQADQTLSVAVVMQKSLKEIAKVTSRSASSLVKPGTTADVYSVSSKVQAAAVALGGGGGLNNAFSAVASVPGVFVPQGQTGAYQSVFVRGGNYTQLGYEYDGVPIQRAFDQYPGGNLSNLGQQELQVYTGAPPVTTGSTALAGFINQVIKTGTYPGFGGIKFGIGAPTFYHQMQIEAGGATPNRLFSYYAGLNGYDQDFRFQTNDQFDSTYGGTVNVLKANCTTPNPTAGCYKASVGGVKAGPNGFLLGPLFWGSTSHIADRDVVVNFHFGLPHKYDGGKDDFQLLYNNTYLRTMFASSLNDFGAHANDIVNGTYTYANGTVIPGCSSTITTNCTVYGGTPLTYVDKVVYTGPTGTFLGTGDLSRTTGYFFPNSPTNRPLNATINPSERDSYQQNAAIVKAQYQRNISSNSYLRVFGYTTYSDWLQYGPGGFNPNFYGSISQDYKLGSHTHGVEANYANQINDKHLLNVTASYTTASTFRNNSSVALSGSTTASGSGSDSNTIAFLVDSTNPTNGQCYTGAGAAVSCGSSLSARYVLPGAPGPLVTAHGTDPTVATAGTKTCGGGPCTYLVVNQGISAVYNTVTPKFSSLAVQDSFKPNDKLLINLGVRYDDFRYGLTDTTGNAARTFWVNWYNKYNCIDPTQNNAVVAAPSPGSCPAPLTPINFSAKSASQNDYPEWQPRIGATYTLDPYNVIRLSYGRYAQPASSAFQQYDTSNPNLIPTNANFISSGFLSPSHIINPELSYNLDGSWQHQAKGTDVSFSVTPYLRKTRDELITVVLDPKTNFVSGINVGAKTVKGVELAVQKGDISRNGLFAKLSYTYTKATVKYSKLPNGTTVVDSLNNGVKNYNGFTQFCANNPSSQNCPSAATVAANAVPCFTTAGAPAPTCPAGSVANPYYNAPAKPLFSATADYPVYSTLASSSVFSGSSGSYIVPHVLALVANYKHDKFNITPTFQLQAGGVYGRPLESAGVNPKTCSAVLAGSTSNDPRYNFGAAGGSPYNAASCSGSLSIPDAYTGNFDTFGAFKQPTKWAANLAMSYDVSPRVTLNVIGVNVLTGCSGGSKVPWAIGGKGGCVYGGGLSAGNFYNPGDVIQQGYQYPYKPVFGNVFQSTSGGQANPFQLYVNANIKI